MNLTILWDYPLLEMRQILKEKKPILGFDGIRAICVLLVLAHHSGLGGGIIDLGGLGVNIFFVLSGYLLIPILYKSKERFDNRQAYFEFLRNRSIRIFPAYYISLTFLFMPYFILMIYRSVPLYVSHKYMAIYLYIYMTNFYIAYVLKDWPGSVSHFWSLAIEQQFYVLFPLFILAINRGKWMTFMLLLLACLVVIGFSFFDDELSFHVSSAVGFSAIISGGVAALSRSHMKFNFAGLVLISLMPAIYFYLEHVGYYKIAFFFSIIIISYMLSYINFNQEGFVVRILEFKYLRAIGIVSYGFYVYHNFMVSMAGVIAAKIFNVHANSGGAYSGPSYHLGKFVIAALLTILISILSFIFIEKPILRLKRTCSLTRSDEQSEHKHAVT